MKRPARHAFLIVAFAIFWIAADAQAQAYRPKLLFFDGVEVNADGNATKAAYWGQTIGVQGFISLGAFSWDDAVGDGDTPSSKAIYDTFARFQSIYSQYGVTDNFIKLAMYTPMNLQDAGYVARTADHFRQAARLARVTGLKGVAIDVEPYVEPGAWAADPAIPNKDSLLLQLGAQIATAIFSEYPGALVVTFFEVLAGAADPHFNYFTHFWYGFLTHVPATAQGPNGTFPVIVGTESTYAPRVAVDQYAAAAQSIYNQNAQATFGRPLNIPLMIGLWPLGGAPDGMTYNKQAWESPQEFQAQLRQAYAYSLRTQSPYLWIYGHGSAWETNGFVSKDPVVANFNEYVGAIAREKAYIDAKINFVAGFYNQVLGRSGSQGDIAAWVSSLSQGNPRALSDGFFLSPEFLGRPISIGTHVAIDY